MYVCMYVETLACKTILYVFNLFALQAITRLKIGIMKQIIEFDKIDSMLV